MAHNKIYSPPSIDEAPSRHGGAGRGQGRKPADGATDLKRRNISIDDARADILRRLGDDDLSLGIRRAADMIARDTDGSGSADHP